jgi:hypothetical protein
MRRSTSFVIILLLAQSIACLTQTPQDASALIEANISSADLNAKDALYYTFHEDDSNIVPDILGTPPNAQTAWYPMDDSRIYGEFRI